MINLFDRNSELLETLDQINEKLKANESNISYQSSEIEKTEKIMANFQECLKNQNNALIEFSKERVKLEEQKEKCLESLRNNENTITKTDTTIILDDDDDEEGEIVEKSDSKSENFDRFKTTKSLKFYRAIIDHLCLVHPSNDVQYLNQTVIPNELKTATTKRKMILKRIDIIGEYPLDNLIFQEVKQSFDIHISLGSGELIAVRNEGKQTQYNMILLKHNNSFAITQDQTVATYFVLSVIKAPMILALEINNCDQDISKSLTKFHPLAAYTYTSDKYEDSFVKMSLSLQEIRQRLLFIDASFALSVQDELVPIAITALDYYGKILINTVICPRLRIKDFRAIKHGLLEKDIIGKPDSNEILDYLHIIANDKIIVGHDLHDKIRDLKIDLKYICGIRDLQSSLILKSIIDPSKTLFNLSTIANRILGEECSINGLQSANESVNIIRNAYIKVEYQWRDKIAIPALINNEESIDCLKSKNVKARLGWLSRMKIQVKKRKE